MGLSNKFKDLLMWGAASSLVFAGLFIATLQYLRVKKREKKLRAAKTAPAREAKAAKNLTKKETVEDNGKEKDIDN